MPPKAIATSITHNTTMDFVADTYTVTVPDASMEPRFREGYLLYVTSSEAPTAGDDVVVKTVTGELLKELVSIDDQVVQLRQFNPAKLITVQRRDVVSLHPVVAAQVVSPARMRAAGMPAGHGGGPSF